MSREWENLELVGSHITCKCSARPRVCPSQHAGPNRHKLWQFAVYRNVPGDFRTVVGGYGGFKHDGH